MVTKTEVIMIVLLRFNHVGFKTYFDPFFMSNGSQELIYNEND